MIQIKKYSKNNKDEVLKIFKQYPVMFGDEDISNLEKDLNESYSNKRRKVVATDNEEVLGFAELVQPKDSVRIWYLEWLVVKKGNQSKGIGTKLLEYMETEVGKTKKSRICIDTLFDLDEGTKNTLKFYRHRGYRSIGVIPDYYGKYGSKIIFYKDLNRKKANKSSIKIRKAKSEDLSIIWSIISACSDWLLNQGHPHWEMYYNKKFVEEKLNDKNKDFYILSYEGKPVGTIALSTTPIEYYEKKDFDNFEDPRATAMYFTAIAVHPDYQNLGLASLLLEFGEEETKKRGVRYIRFDTRVLIESISRFYMKRGYKVVGVITDPEENDEPYFLFEKKLD